MSLLMDVPLRGGGHSTRSACDAVPPVPAGKGESRTPAMPAAIHPVLSSTVASAHDAHPAPTPCELPCHGQVPPGIGANRGRRAIAGGCGFLPPPRRVHARNPEPRTSDVWRHGSCRPAGSLWGQGDGSRVDAGGSSLRVRPGHAASTPFAQERGGWMDARKTPGSNDSGVTWHDPGHPPPAPDRDGIAISGSLVEQGTPRSHPPGEGGRSGGYAVLLHRRWRPMPTGPHPDHFPTVPPPRHGVPPRHAMTSRGGGDRSAKWEGVSANRGAPGAGRMGEERELRWRVARGSMSGCPSQARP